MAITETREWDRVIKETATDQLNLLQELAQAMRRGDLPASYSHRRGCVDTSLEIAYAQRWLPHLDINPLFAWHESVVDWFHSGVEAVNQTGIVLRARHALMEIRLEAIHRESAPTPPDRPTTETPEASTPRKKRTKEAVTFLVTAAISFKMKNPEWSETQCARAAMIGVSTLHGRSDWQEWQSKIEVAHARGRLNSLKPVFDKRLGETVAAEEVESE